MLSKDVPCTMLSKDVDALSKDAATCAPTPALAAPLASLLAFLAEGGDEEDDDAGPLLEVPGCLLLLLLRSAGATISCSVNSCNAFK